MRNVLVGGIRWGKLVSATIYQVEIRLSTERNVCEKESVTSGPQCRGITNFGYGANLERFRITRPWWAPGTKPLPLVGCLKRGAGSTHPGAVDAEDIAQVLPIPRILIIKGFENVASRYNKFADFQLHGIPIPKKHGFNPRTDQFGITHVAVKSVAIQRHGNEISGKCRSQAHQQARRKCISVKKRSAFFYQGRKRSGWMAGRRPSNYRFDGPESIPPYPFSPE